MRVAFEATLTTLWEKQKMLNAIINAKKNIAPIIEDMGYEVVDIEYKKVFNDMNLTIFIHKAGGITLEDCEKVNAALNEPLETYDITNGKPYILNISSPGLDRPIRTDKDLKRNIDTEIEILLIEPAYKKRKIVGKLIDFNDENIKVVYNGKKIALNRTNIKLIKPYIKF